LILTLIFFYIIVIAFTVLLLTISELVYCWIEKLHTSVFRFFITFYYSFWEPHHNLWQYWAIIMTVSIKMKRKELHWNLLLFLLFSKYGGCHFLTISHANFFYNLLIVIYEFLENTYKIRVKKGKKRTKELWQSKVMITFIITHHMVKADSA